LFLIFFLWLFAFTGLLLNHPTWAFHEFWQNRKQTSYERDIAAPEPNANGDLGQARDIMRQLGIDGERKSCTPSMAMWPMTRAIAAIGR
jgi:hypothetical protein